MHADLNNSAKASCHRCERLKIYCVINIDDRGKKTACATCKSKHEKCSLSGKVLIYALILYQIKLIILSTEKGKTYKVSIGKKSIGNQFQFKHEEITNIMNVIEEMDKIEYNRHLVNEEIIKNLDIDTCISDVLNEGVCDSQIMIARLKGHIYSMNKM